MPNVASNSFQFDAPSSQNRQFDPIDLLDKTNQEHSYAEEQLGPEDEAEIEK